jgi:cold shock CspA family protein
MNSMENEKQIGLVKWFHDKSKDSNYGFIQHIKLGDLYFNENSIDIGQDIHSFRENAIVIFKAINQETAKHKGKLKAIEVKYLENETNCSR